MTSETYDVIARRRQFKIRAQRRVGSFEVRAGHFLLPLAMDTSLQEHVRATLCAASAGHASVAPLDPDYPMYMWFTRLWGLVSTENGLFAREVAALRELPPGAGLLRGTFRTEESALDMSMEHLNLRIMAMASYLSKVVRALNVDKLRLSAEFVAPDKREAFIRACDFLLCHPNTNDDFAWVKHPEQLPPPLLRLGLQAICLQDKLTQAEVCEGVFASSKLTRAIIDALVTPIEYMSPLIVTHGDVVLGMSEAIVFFQDETIAGHILQLVKGLADIYHSNRTEFVEAAVRFSNFHQLGFVFTALYKQQEEWDLYQQGDRRGLRQHMLVGLLEKSHHSIRARGYIAAHYPSFWQKNHAARYHVNDFQNYLSGSSPNVYGMMMILMTILHPFKKDAADVLRVAFDGNIAQAMNVYTVSATTGTIWTMAETEETWRMTQSLRRSVVDSPLHNVWQDVIEHFGAPVLPQIAASVQERALVTPTFSLPSIFEPTQPLGQQADLPFLDAAGLEEALSASPPPLIYPASVLEQDAAVLEEALAAPPPSLIDPASVLEQDALSWNGQP